MIKDVFFYFVLPIVALVICTICGVVGLIVALVLTICVQIYNFRQSLASKKQIENLEQRQNGLDNALNVVREEDGTVTGMMIDAGEY